MTDLPGIVVTGVSGRMGQMLVKTIRESGRARLCGALERPGHDWVGQDLGRAMGGAESGVLVSDDALEVLATCDAVSGARMLAALRVRTTVAIVESGDAKRAMQIVVA